MTEVIICMSLAAALNLEDLPPVYIFGDENDASIERIELAAGVVFNWTGSAQLLQGSSTKMCSVTLNLTVAKNGMTAERIGIYITAIRRAIEEGWQEQQISIPGHIRIHEFRKGQIRGVNAVPRQTQHDNGEGMVGEVPVYTVGMQWIFHIYI